MKKHHWIFLVFSPLLAVFLAGVNVYYDIHHRGYKGQSKIFEVRPGEPFSRVNQRLYDAKFIKSRKVFHKYAQFKDLMTKIKAGRYQIENGQTMALILEMLTIGKSLVVPVTIPEGKNLYQIAEILENNKITDKNEFIKIAKNENFASKLGIPARTLEGYLYPDTYNFTPNSNAKDVARSMVDTFKYKTKGIVLKKDKLGAHEVIILASIVEKETGAKSERPIIAGVFLNRLKKRMRLQSDPTTIYGIWESYNGNIRKKHLLQKTPYNTYKIKALPIGPISNPGLLSIKSVLNPAPHDYLYFVSKNDGTHVFSKTYKEHNKAVHYFQKRRSSRKGKSWRDLKQ